MDKEENRNVKLEKLINDYLVFDSKAKELADYAKNRKEQIIAEMKAEGYYTYNGEKAKLAYIPETERFRFDSKTFTQDHPKLAKEYQKPSKVSESVRITITKAVD